MTKRSQKKTTKPSKDTTEKKNSNDGQSEAAVKLLRACTVQDVLDHFLRCDPRSKVLVATQEGMSMGISHIIDFPKDTEVWMVVDEEDVGWEQGPDEDDIDLGPDDADGPNYDNSVPIVLCELDQKEEKIEVIQVDVCAGTKAVEL